MRIALFTDTYLPQTNGVSRTLAHLVRYLSECGHEVALVAPRVGSEAQAAPPGVALHLPLGGVPVPVYPELLLTRVPFRSERRALERFDPEIVHCATESTVGWSGRRFALRTARPLVGSCLLVSTGLLVGVSRCYLGVHYPSDVVAGWMLAVIAVLSTWVLLGGWVGSVHPC